MSEVLPSLSKYIVPTLAAMAISGCGQEKSAETVTIPACPEGFVQDNSKPLSNPGEAAYRLAGGTKQYAPKLFTRIDTPEEALCTDGDKLYYSPAARIVMGAVEAAHDKQRHNR